MMVGASWGRGEGGVGRRGETAVHWKRDCSRAAGRTPSLLITLSNEPWENGLGH